MSITRNCFFFLFSLTTEAIESSEFSGVPIELPAQMLDYAQQNSGWWLTWGVTGRMIVLFALGCSRLISALGNSASTASRSSSISNPSNIGDVGRNVLRGPFQSEIDISLAKRFPVSESKNLEVRADFFNALNHPSRSNPTSDITTAASFDTSGRILSLGDFGRSLSFDSSPKHSAITQF
jgi:hypothetical protein